MGANLNFETYKNCSNEDLKSKFKETQEQLSYEDGNGAYAGHLGILPGISIKDITFKTQEEAEDYIEKNHQKWNAALAVKYNAKISKNKIQNASEDKLTAKIKLLNNELKEYPNLIIKRVKSQTSAQKGCKNCDSKINIKYIKSVHCPVCLNDFLYTDTDNKKIISIRNQIKDLEIKLKEETKKRVTKVTKTDVKVNEVRWLVGGWCPS